MSFDFDPHFTSWGPFIQHETFQIQPLSQAAFIAATTIFVITGFVACSTAYAAFKQTKRSRGPWSSGYIWMIWMEWASCVALAIICMLHLLRVIRPSFYFYGACCKGHRLMTDPSANSSSGAVGYSDTMFASNHHQPDPNHPPRSQEGKAFDDSHDHRHVGDQY